MRKTQRGFIEIITILVMAIIAFIVWFVCTYVHQTNTWNAWNQDCTRHHGVVGEVKDDLLSTGYECFINGKIVTLPGWESYSTGIKN